MRRILVRAYCNVNFGDDLFVKILVERYPDTFFYLITSKDKTYKKLFKQTNVKIIRLPGYTIIERVIRKIIRFFSKREELKIMNRINSDFIRKLNKIVDGFIYIGGSIFMQSENVDFTLNNLNKIISKNIQKNKYILSANFGPYLTNSYLKYHEEMFKDFDDICFRDLYSKSLFRSLCNIRYAPDIAFGFNPPIIGKNKKTVGFSLIDVSRIDGIKEHTSNYLDLIANLLTYYIQEGYNVYLFSFCKNEGDEFAINTLISRLPNLYEKKLNTVLFDGNIQKFINIYGSIEYFYPTRFHSMVLSMLFKQKIFPFVYSDKTMHVLKDISFNGTYANIGEIEKFSVNQIINSIENNSYDIETVCIDSKKQFKKIDEFLRPI